MWMRFVMAPGNLLLISGDGGFASTLMDVKRNYHNSMVAYNKGYVPKTMSYICYIFSSYGENFSSSREFPSVSVCNGFIFGHQNIINKEKKC